MKRSQIYRWKSYCSEPIDKIEHYEEALADNFAGWCMHHRLEIQHDGTRVSAQELIDKGLYFHRPASELVFMKVGEHRSLHCSLHNIGNTYMKGHKHSADTRQKIAEANKGKHHTEKTRQKISESLKGKHNCTKDSLWWNDGISNKRSKECPGPEWKRGCLKKT